jgi:hypothetical protein
MTLNILKLSFGFFPSLLFPLLPTPKQSQASIPVLSSCLTWLLPTAQHEEMLLLSSVDEGRYQVYVSGILIPVCGGLGSMSGPLENA